MPGNIIRAREAAELLGCSPRTIQDMARRGKIPGAAQLVPRGMWTFDRDKLIAFRQRLEQEVQRRAEARPVWVPAASASNSWDELPPWRQEELYRQAIGIRPNPSPGDRSTTARSGRRNLYKRKGVWYGRIEIGGHEYRQSLKTPRVGEATERLEEWIGQLTAEIRRSTFGKKS